MIVPLFFRSPGSPPWLFLCPHSSVLFHHLSLLYFSCPGPSTSPSTCNSCSLTRCDASGCQLRHRSCRIAHVVARSRHIAGRVGSHLLSLQGIAHVHEFAFWPLLWTLGVSSFALRFAFAFFFHSSSLFYCDPSFRKHSMPLRIFLSPSTCLCPSVCHPPCEFFPVITVLSAVPVFVGFFPTLFACSQ